ncbi:energy transducer TonB [Niabella beijingensis]|uniref:energy transducer TonB n=1 Tax=Niabella beijingensis TaxID=2872700 RepID=UPI001CBD71C7|nr:energy transducer TonB [Niabella beijingensis]MBZ4191239.1 energy transducer TonB [Niabella beijingensis]
MVTYLLQVICCSGILYGYYHFFLRNERFHQYNRFYLLAAVLLSITLPLLRIRLSLEGNNVITQSLGKIYLSEEPAAAATTPVRQIDWALLSGWVALTIGAFFFIRFVAGIIKVVQIKRQGQQEQLGRITFIKTIHPYAPFSFFNWLFWNKNHNPGSDEGKQILRHEMYHIHKRHTLDLLFVELLLCLYWINPFFYLYRKEVKMIQEFLADRYAAKETDPLNYAGILVTSAIQQKQLLLTNPFFNNQLKRRIAMLTKNNKTAYQYLRKIMVLPLSVLVFCLFAFTYHAAGSLPEAMNDIRSTLFPAPSETIRYSPGNDSLYVFNGTPISKEKFFDIPTSDIKQVIVLDEKKAAKIYGEKGSNGAVIVIGKNYKDVKSDPALELIKRKNNLPDSKVPASEIAVVAYTSGPSARQPVKVDPELSALKIGGNNYFTTTEQPATYNGNWARFLASNVRGDVPVINNAAPGSYRTAYQFVVEADGSTSNIRPLTAIGYGMEEEGVRILKKSGAWTAAIQNGRKVRTAHIQYIHFQVVPAAAAPAITPAPDTIPKNVPREPEIFTKVEQEAKYTGDWVHFLSTNLRGDVPVKNGAKPGNYQALIQFIVDTEGNVSNVKVIKEPGYGMGEEAARVISSSGKWIPARQNKRVVKAYRKQPITFQVAAN